MAQTIGRAGSKRQPRRATLRGVAAALVAVAGTAAAAADPAALCTAAARHAAAETGVPIDVLTAVMLTETGRATADTGWSPWPWAVNRGGDGTWHGSADAARAAVSAVLATGSRNVDIGCFQLNHRWHADAFASLDAMLDPAANARYAARFLSDLHDEFGDWTAAAGAYHSRTPALAERYAARFAAHRARLAGAADAPMPAIAQPRANHYPLLRVGSAGRGPSLFPDDAPARPMIAPAAAPLIGNG